MIDLTKEQITKCFEGKEHQADVLIALYRIAIPKWDDVVEVKGYPAVSNATWHEICRQFISFDCIHHPDVMHGGLWMSQGFTVKEQMPDWKILEMDKEDIVYGHTG